VLFFDPGLVRVFLPFPAELDWWNRILALPVFNLGILCIGSAVAKSRLLIKLTAATRLQQSGREGFLLLRERAGQRAALLPGARAHRLSADRHRSSAGA
jgi:hypothetical protein